MDDLSDLVRRADEDRWLASRFAPADARRRLVAIYALNYEIARTADVVTQAALGDIRLAWWREGIAEVFDAKPVRAHPALEAFDAMRDEAAWPRALLLSLTAAAFLAAATLHLSAAPQAPLPPVAAPAAAAQASPEPTPETAPAPSPLSAPDAAPAPSPAPSPAEWSYRADEVSQRGVLRVRRGADVYLIRSPRYHDWILSWVTPHIRAEDHAAL